MPSSAQKGAYWKGRTKKWLIDKGWQVADMEVVRWVYTPRGRVPTKRDQFGSDLMAMNATDLVFVQVKGGKTKQLAAARRAFQQYQFPAWCLLWVVYWKPRARAPEVIPVDGDSRR